MVVKRLDLGGGAGYMTLGQHSFTTVDLENGDIIHDLRDTPLPFPDNSVEVIHCSATLEHLLKQEAINLIKDCYRILEPGGVLTLMVPDMDIFIEGHLTGDWSKHPEGTLLTSDLNYCAGSSEFPRDHPWSHKYLWCFESLAYVLEKTGFVDIVKHGHYDSPHKHLFPEAYNIDQTTIGLYIDAIKPINKEKN